VCVWLCCVLVSETTAGARRWLHGVFCYTIDMSMTRSEVETIIADARAKGEHPNLARLNLRDANLTGVNLYDANLTDADLHWANLKDANLTGANLESANLESANLTGANLESANLESAKLTHANLTDANLSGAKLVWANLKNADLYRADLTGADLEDANLAGVDLYGADLREANLNHVNLWDVNLYDASLKSVIKRVDLSGAHLADDPMTLIDHEVPEVRAWAAERITDRTALMQLAMDGEEVVRAAVLENDSATDEMRVAVTLQR